MPSGVELITSLPPKSNSEELGIACVMFYPPVGIERPSSGKMACLAHREDGLAELSLAG